MSAMTPADRDRAVKQLEDTIALIKAMPVVTPCSKCMYLCHDSGICSVWNAKVPAEAVAVGCNKWEEDIPF